MSFPKFVHGKPYRGQKEFDGLSGIRFEVLTREGGEYPEVVGSKSLRIGGRVRKVVEHSSSEDTVVVCEVELYPEPKVLSPNELDALHERLGGNGSVARHVGATKDFVRDRRRGAGILWS